jgi:adenylate cyclase
MSVSPVTESSVLQSTDPGRRVGRSFAFLDLSGFTAYTAEEGDSAAVEVLAHLRATVRRLAERHGVRVTKWLGDGVMLSSPNTDRLVECCVRSRDQIRGTGVLALRGGICHGDVIMFEGDDYVGEAVNVAARLCAVAAPGELLAEAASIQLVPAAQVRPRGDVRLRGTPSLIELVEVLGLTPGAE